MQLLSTKTQQQIEWRRDRVLELSSQGLTQSDIATVLKVDKSIISRDAAYLRQQAKDNLQKHINQNVPEEYQRCLVGINQVLKMAWSIVSKDIDNKTKLQALALINDCNKYKMELTTNGVVITDAIKYVQGQMDHLNNQEKALLQDIKNKEENENKTDGEAVEPETEAEETTTNGVF